MAGWRRPRIDLIGWALRPPGGLEEGGEPRRHQPDPFPPRHLRRQRRGAARRHHRLRPGRHVRPARRALEPPGPGPVRPRAALRGPRGRAAAQRRPDPRGGVRPAALRSLLHHGQHAPGRRRGGLHRGRLRRSHAHHLGCAGTPGRRAGRPHTGRGPPAHDRARRRRRRPHVIRRVRRRLARGAVGRRGRGLRHALLLGHHRPPQGDPTAAHRAALRLRCRPLGHVGRDHGLRPGGRVPLSGAALPLRPARVVHDGPAPRRHGRGHGALRPRAVPGPHRTAQGDARPVRPDHVRAHAQAARRRAGEVRPFVPALGCACRSALPVRGQAPHDRLVGTGDPRVLLGHRRPGNDVDHRGGGADASRLGGQGDLGRGARVRRRRGGPPRGRRRRRVLRGAHRGRDVPVQPRSGEDPPDLQRQGVGHAVGRRASRRRGLPVPDRSQAVHDRVRRREHLPPGDRGRPGAAPRGDRRGRLRRPRSRNGGAGQGGRPARSRRPARAGARGRDHRLLPGAICPTTSARARSISPICCPAARTASSTRRCCARPTGPAPPPAPPEPRAAFARRRTRPGRGRRRRRRAAPW